MSGHGKPFIEGQLRAHLDEHSSEYEDGADSFFVADLGEVYRQYLRWKKMLKRVKPFYAVKCNPDVEVIRLLSSFGIGFDCASRGEIAQILSLGIESSRIIYANPCKSRAHLRYAQCEGITRMTFDGADELYKIKAIAPRAELLLRITADDSSSVGRFSHKFGAPLNSVGRLFEIGRELALDIVGVSFHIGTGATDPRLFVYAVQNSKMIFDQAREYGYSLKVLDVGGGFSTESFENMSETLAHTLDDNFAGEVELIAEPGRFFVESAFNLACNIIARRDVRDIGVNPKYMLYLNDGVYGSFMDVVLSHLRCEPHVLLSADKHRLESGIKYSIWGPSCDGIDQILEEIIVCSILDIGDWLYFENMGAYSLCLSTSFNGFPSEHKVYYVSSEPAVRVPKH